VVGVVDGDGGFAAELGRSPAGEAFPADLRIVSDIDGEAVGVTDRPGDAAGGLVLLASVQQGIHDGRPAVASGASFDERDGSDHALESDADQGGA
jgi:hypothetical protein